LSVVYRVIVDPGHGGRESSGRRTQKICIVSHFVYYTSLCIVKAPL
jgi:hypothetical protein